LVIRCTFRDENESSEISLSLSCEMRPSQGIAAIFEYVLVKLFVLLLFDFLLIAHPKWFVFVDSFEFDSLNVFSSCSVHLVLDLIFVQFLSFGSPFFSNFLDLGFDFGFSLLNFFLSYHDFLEIDGVIDKAAISFNESSELFILAVFRGIFFQVKSDDSTSF